MSELVENKLPAEILAKADLRHNEYAWRVVDLPEVIAAAKALNLLNLGGQLQLRTADAIGEVYWVAVDPCQNVPEDLPWEVRVRMAADFSLRDLAEIQAEFDFLQELRDAFPEPVADLLASGGKLEDALWFAWYVEADG
ncbi:MULTISPECIES: hypothetical protein [Asticcacaulis]|uniref:hypothetical protein n=1 Tax=Asticcacaulis TaxID=76890 RepID=UPI001AEA3EC8|nr:MULTISPECIES: hypothetical protein [Asticcacaulis]MBP2159912.1 hypothetical protein [Asticcacaulis solisilvae]MDR6800957.1 hypothetical protein [Asticcacaulis sp. BE141]